MKLQHGVLNSIMQDMVLNIFEKFPGKNICKSIPRKNICKSSYYFQAFMWIKYKHVSEEDSRSEFPPPCNHTLNSYMMEQLKATQALHL